MTSKKNNFIFLFTFSVLILVFYSCNLDTSENNGTSNVTTLIDNSDDISNITVKNNSKIYDSSNNFLGYAVNITNGEIILYTSKSFLITIHWDGTLAPSVKTIFFKETDAKGTPFFVLSSDGMSNEYESNKGMYGNVIFKAPLNKMYTFKNLSNNSPVFNQGSLLTKSIWWGSFIENREGNSSSSYYSELIEVSLSDIGIPDNITLPIKISFE